MFAVALGSVNVDFVEHRDCFYLYELIKNVSKRRCKKL